METGRAVLLREMLAAKCDACREGEMPFLWRCPAGVKDWTEGWHHAESDCDGWDDGNLCDASDLIDQHDPTGTTLGGEVYDTACVCPCHEDGQTAFGEEPGACHHCENGAYEYGERIGLTGDKCTTGHLIARADEAEAVLARVRAEEVEPLVALLRRAVVDRGEPECAVSRRLIADIRAALKAHEDE